MNEHKSLIDHVVKTRNDLAGREPKDKHGLAFVNAVDALTAELFKAQARGTVIGVTMPNEAEPTRFEVVLSTSKAPPVGSHCALLWWENDRAERVTRPHLQSVSD